MIFKFNDFVVYTKEQEKNKQVLDSLTFLDKETNKQHEVINDLFDFIDLIEILRAFNNNKLDTSKTYNINDKFTAKTVQKNSNMYLQIHFKNYSNKEYYDKFECASLVAKFSKILSKCELWQEQEA